MHKKQILILLIVVVSIFSSDDLFPVEYWYPKMNYIVKSYIKEKDWAEFHKTPLKKRWSYLNGPTKIHYIWSQRKTSNGWIRKTNLHLEGTYKEGKKVGIWRRYPQVGKDRLIDYKYKYNRSGKMVYRIKYDDYRPYLSRKRKDGRTRGKRRNRVESRTFYHPYFEDYQAGFSFPLTMGYTYPLGVSLSAVNFYAEIPGKRLYFARPTLVLASEVGYWGPMFNLGLSPYARKSAGHKYLGTTPFTCNGSLSYIRNGKERPHIPGDRWYWGVNADWQTSYAHVRLGAQRLIGHEEDRPWKVTFTVGAGLQLLGIFFWAM